LRNLASNLFADCVSRGQDKYHLFISHQTITMIRNACITELPKTAPRRTNVGMSRLLAKNVSAPNVSAPPSFQPVLQQQFALGSLPSAQSPASPPSSPELDRLAHRFANGPLSFDHKRRYDMESSDEQGRQKRHKPEPATPAPSPSATPKVHYKADSDDDEVICLGSSHR
jgi:hypothetical protein